MPTQTLGARSLSVQLLTSNSQLFPVRCSHPQTMFYLILTCIIALLWLAWMAVSWWSLLYEKRRPLTLTPIPDTDPRTRNDYAMLFGRQAEAVGFERLGTWVDGDPSWRQGVSSMLLRPDALILLRIHHAALLKKVVCISATTSDTWLITASSIGDPDATGLSEEEVLVTSKDLAPVLAHHEARIAGREHELIPWSPDEVIADLIERDRRKVQALLQTGRARVRDQLTGTWSFTVQGAQTQRALMQKFFKEMVEQGKKK